MELKVFFPSTQTLNQNNYITIYIYIVNENAAPLVSRFLERIWPATCVETIKENILGGSFVGFGH